MTIGKYLEQRAYVLFYSIYVLLLINLGLLVSFKKSLCVFVVDFVLQK